MWNIDCPECSTTLEAPDEFASRSLECGNCGRLFTLKFPVVWLVPAEDLRSAPSADHRGTQCAMSVVGLAILIVGATLSSFPTMLMGVLLMMIIGVSQPP